jgi:hypothetical protein
MSNETLFAMLISADEAHGPGSMFEPAIGIDRPFFMTDSGHMGLGSGTMK